RRIEAVDAEQALADLVLEVEELVLAVAQVRQQQAVADPFAQGHRAGVEQQRTLHGNAPMCAARRAPTCSGVTAGRGRLGEAPGRVRRWAKRGPARLPASNSWSITSMPSDSSASG